MNNINSEPWLRSIPVRMTAIRNAIKYNKKIILYIYEAADTSTFRYRCYNVMRASEKSKKYYCEYFFSNTEKDQIKQILKLADIVVIVRVQWSLFIDQVIKKAHINKKIVLFDCDDLVFDIDSLPILMNTLGFHDRMNFEPDYIGWFSYVSRIGFTASKCDGFITTNSFLGEIFKKKFNKPYTIVKNSLNKEQISVSNECIRNKTKNPLYKEFTIGYFSGSPSHTNDFLQVAPEIAHFLDEHTNSKLNVVGFMEFPRFMKKYIDEKRIIFQPLVDFCELQHLISQVHVNIVPLIDNVFTNCKSELKFFEAAIVNTITLATPIYSYRTSIRNNNTGFLCNPGEWFKTLELIYFNKINYNEITDNARRYVLEEYFGNKFLNEIEYCFDYYNNINL